ncbi:hypothetical protein CXF68_14135 [Tenacibaculum sp. Bg11-29]|nr:hypothetical protein CXF68_14135 [Tenacibaculum sp. Bg11-29]
MRSTRLKKTRGLHVLKCATLFFILFLVVNCLYSQELKSIKVDTLSLNRFENVVLQTNNGSDCICLINNPSSAQNAIITAMGAPEGVLFDNNSLFNGIHTLAVKEQIIALNDFKGQKLTIANLTQYAIRILIYFYCTE